ncbi:hypothetical protein ABVB70_22355 [Agrobacterium radiobacter]|uniref:Transposase n=1 Tax=Agrobacterium radiobacter TaxID=362 RepID=A0ABD5LPL6_AGRRD
MDIPRTFYRNSTLFDRVTIVFLKSMQALSARSLVHDALIRAHGFATASGLTSFCVKRIGRFRTGIARGKIKALKRRLRLLVEAGIISLFVRGKRVSFSD